MNAEQVIAEALWRQLQNGDTWAECQALSKDSVAALRTALTDPASRDEVLRSLGMARSWGHWLGMVQILQRDYRRERVRANEGVEHVRRLLAFVRATDHPSEAAEWAEPAPEPET